MVLATAWAQWLIPFVINYKYESVEASPVWPNYWR